MRMVLEIIDENEHYFNNLGLSEFKGKLPYYFKERYNAILDLNKHTLTFQNRADYLVILMKYD